MIYQTQSSLQSQFDASLGDPSSFASQLRDAIVKTEIMPDLAIAHSDYQPLVTSDRYRQYIQQISPEERENYLITKLQHYLYAIFNGELSSEQSPDSGNEIVNDVSQWYETKFFARLVRCNRGRGYRDDNWAVIEREAERWRVAKDGLKLYVNPQTVESDLESSIGQTVSILMPPNLIEPGLYVAVGDAGSTRNLPKKSAIAQLYFNVAPQTALKVLDTVSEQFNKLQIPFDFKIPYSETNFHRLDTPVLEFLRADWQKIREIVKDIYQQNQSGFFTQIPFFCQQLELGLGLAEKPLVCSQLKIKNMGLKYCHIIAQIILRINKEANLSELDKLELATSYLSATKINWKYFYVDLDLEYGSDRELYVW